MGGALASQPGSAELSQAIDDAIKNPGGVARHYLCCQVVSWGGEVVTSVFVHVSLQGSTLYIEFATYALFPVRPEYVTNSVRTTSAMEIARILGSAATRVTRSHTDARRLLGAPMVLVSAWRAESRRASTLTGWGGSGAESSIREAAMIQPPAESRDESASGYFQAQDVIQHSKIIERRLIATIGEYLTETGVNTSEFVQRTTVILNNGVMNTGSGTISADNLAVGTNSAVQVQMESI
jgi:hypothetical protein